MRIYIPSDKKAEYDKREESAQWEEFKNHFDQLNKYQQIDIYLRVRWLSLMHKIKRLLGIQ
jgi:hypothetical protein